ncbi:hypothetical protein [Pseudomonas sp. NPDC008258]|uniref:hypothetical protein n=1 Tax=Pseudomonas sp. NPDC008258 TaxID=3364418 RepID=UPI0036E6E9C1
MYSTSEFVKIYRASPPLRQIQLLLIMMCTVLPFAALYYSDLKVYKAPDFSRLTFVEGRVSGYPDTWEHNRSIMHFAVAYTLDGVRYGKGIYTYPALYKESGLRINKKVSLTVERLDDGSQVRELATLDGRVLFDDRFHQQVIAWNNQSIKFKVVVAGLMSFGLAVAALVVAIRYRGKLFQAG